MGQSSVISTTGNTSLPGFLPRRRSAPARSALRAGEIEPAVDAGDRRWSRTGSFRGRRRRQTRRPIAPSGRPRPQPSRAEDRRLQRQTLSSRPPPHDAVAPLSGRSPDAAARRDARRCRMRTTLIVAPWGRQHALTRHDWSVRKFAADALASQFAAAIWRLGTSADIFRQSSYS
jgi:hypothetical protein